MDDAIAKMMKWTLVAYFAATFLIFEPAFNWRYIANHSYPKWKQEGVFHATARALAWPVFIKDLRESSVVRVKSAIEHMNDAMMILPTEHRKITRDEFITFTAHIEKALAEAEAVDCDFLNDHYPEMGDLFKRQFLRGLELCRDGGHAQNTLLLLRGYLLLETFGKWYVDNLDTIKETF